MRLQSGHGEIARVYVFQKTSDVLQIRVENDMIVLKKNFRHKTFEERLAEYDGKITVADFDYGEPVGKEII